MLNNDVSNIGSQCQVVFFNWNNNIVTSDLSPLDLTASTPIDVSKYITEVSFSKSLSSPAGTFQIILKNDRDWKQTLQRGSWGIIYMSQAGGLSIPSGTDIPDISKLVHQKDKIRGIIYIERVAAKGSVEGERGAFDVEFTVTGRDFGVVYVENEIFFNQLYSEGLFQDAVGSRLKITGTRSVGNLLKTIHNGFLSPDQLGISPLENEGTLLKNMPIQWLLPQNLFQALDIVPLKGTPYFGHIPNLLNFSNSQCSFPVDKPMTLVNGKLWDRLKAYSIEHFHELFPELDDSGLPRLTFRYIPWKTSSGVKLGSLNNGDVLAFTDLPKIVLSALDIIEFDLGEDTHARYNYFLTVPDTALYAKETSLNGFIDHNPRTGFPRIETNSVRRYGLRLMYATINALIQLNSEKVDTRSLINHNELMLEYHNNEVFMETGTISMVGNNSIRIGKALAIEAGVPYNGGKLFYIEGYSDRFISDEKGAGFWSQTLTLTRGITPGKIGKRGEKYVDNGEFTEGN